jgi:hypothetical protein
MPAEKAQRSFLVTGDGIKRETTIVFPAQSGH